MEPIKDFPGYYVAEDGTFYSDRSHRSIKGLRELKLSFIGINYYVYMMDPEGRRRQVTAKTIIAKTFCPNPEGYKDVYFKDGDRDNLESKNLFFGPPGLHAGTIQAYLEGLE